MNQANRNLTASILLTTLVAGTLDIAAALTRFVIKTGKDPLTVLRYIASAIYGPAALSGKNPWTPAAGLFLHYFIVLLFTILFFLIRNQFHMSRWQAVIAGVVYGLVVWSIMNLLVVPLSLAPAIPITFEGAVTEMLILVFCIGIPISMMANMHYLYKKNSVHHVVTESE